VAYHKDSALPSVTAILAPFVDYSRVPAHTLAQAIERGTAVHGLCSARIQGLWHAPVAEGLSGYVKSFDDWARVVSGVVLVEEELVDPVLGYCGHPDLILRIKGDAGMSLVDLKTPAACMPTWRPQLAAYRHLAESNGHEISRVFSLRLAKDGGRAKVDEYTGTVRADFAGFVSALNCWKFFKGAK
jgi:hypothetical protein